MTSADSRPRIVDVAFWCWAVAGVLLIADGLWLFWAGQLAFVKGAGAILLLAGVAVAFLAGRTRRGDKRFHRALVALSMALALLLVLFIVMGGPLLGAFIAALLIAAGVLATREKAIAWFDVVDSGRDSD
jgi:hypothetical protein